MSEEPFIWKDYWRTKAGKKKRQIAKNRAPKFISKRSVKLTPIHYNIFAIYDPVNAKKELWYSLIDYVIAPAERYEWDGQKIIRTVSTLHYLSQQAVETGPCRSFSHMVQRRKHIPRTGKEKVFNVHDDVLDEFCNRYYIGELIPMDFPDTDLDKDINMSRTTINGVYYMFVSLKDKDSDDWGLPKLIKPTKRKAGVINSKIPIKLSQEQIIKKIKLGEITGVHKLGDPKEIYTNEQVLKFIE